MKIYGAQPLRFCEGEAGRGSTTTRTGIFGDQVSSCRAKVLAPTSGSAQGQKQTGSTVWPGNLACWGLPNLGPQTRSAGPGAWTSHTQKEQLSCSPTNWGTRLPDPLNHSAWLGKFGSYVKWAFSQSCPGMSLSWSPTHNRAWLPVLYERKGWQEYLEAS